jgi:hypothetical protein
LYLNTHNEVNKYKLYKKIIKIYLNTKFDFFQLDFQE